MATSGKTAKIASSSGVKMKPIKKLKDDLDKKHRELTKEQRKRDEIIDKLSKQGVTHAEKTKLENDLGIAKINIRSLSVEMHNLSQDIFGDWKPKGKGES
tara:strand:- start:98 stop:397 length:300 start_codon:yes stop_codon:yes gene_type:complete